MGIIVLILIVGVFGFFFYIMRRNLNIKKNGIEADAFITDVQKTYESDEDGNQTVHPIYHVKYTMQDGTGVEAARLWDEPEGLEPGDTVRIKYLPNDPKHTVLAK